MHCSSRSRTPVACTQSIRWTPNNIGKFYCCINFTRLIDVTPANKLLLRRCHLTSTHTESEEDGCNASGSMPIFGSGVGGGFVRNLTYCTTSLHSLIYMLQAVYLTLDPYPPGANARWCRHRTGGLTGHRSNWPSNWPSNWRPTNNQQLLNTI